MVTSGGHFSATIQIAPGPGGDDLRHLIKLLEMILSWLWYHRQAVYLIANSIDGWVSVGAWLWVNRLTFHRAAQTIIAAGELVEAGLEFCGGCWDGWVGLWRPLGMMREAI